MKKQKSKANEIIDNDDIDKFLQKALVVFILLISVLTIIGTILTLLV